MGLKGFPLGILLLLATNSFPQQAAYKFWVGFRDKDHNEYSLDDPGGFLSSASLERRERQGIPLSEEDLPVSQAYLDSLGDFPLRILYATKWMNAAVIQTGDSSLATKLEELPFVREVVCLWRASPNRKSSQDKWHDSLYSAGSATNNQLDMVQGQSLHQEGFRGRGLKIAVLDAGFAYADSIRAFDSLFRNGRILGTRSFVEPDSARFWRGNGSHGTKVLSVMGGLIEGVFTGSAPEAGYWLIETEDIRSEFRIEEANWLAGAELADSAGMDIINSSLGYSIHFTDTLQNYSYADMDGRTALVSRAARLAAEKGILVVASAGNAGRASDPWKYIGAPADAERVLAVGAVKADGIRADFSSRGPSFDGRIKPDVMAQGEAAAVIGTSGQVVYRNGTSFSSPLIAGLAACLWQMNPGIGNDSLMESIRTSASLYPWPDNLYGYGIPNFGVARDILTHTDQVQTFQGMAIYPNPPTDKIYLLTAGLAGGRAKYSIRDLSGRIHQRGEVSVQAGQSPVIPVSALTPGVYVIRLTSRNRCMTGKFYKSR